jgi:hypothetical protein
VGNVTGLAALQAVFAASARVADELAAARVLDKAAEGIRDRAKGKLGTYQGSSGPYNPWNQLAPATLSHKSGDTPLYETGQLEAAIQVLPKPDDHTWLIGISPGDLQEIIGLTQELGNVSRNIPPRPFLAPSIYELQDKIIADVQAVVIGLVSGRGTP